MLASYYSSGLISIIIKECNSVEYPGSLGLFIPHFERVQNYIYMAYSVCMQISDPLILFGIKGSKFYLTNDFIYIPEVG
jgi:hypothetical protein